MRHGVHASTLSLFLCVASVSVACGRNGDASPAATKQLPIPAAATGVIVVPPDSPQMKLLHVAPVRAADIPSDEVTAPGRIIIDPHRVSRALLPVQGRIASVRVGLGATVEEGQPVVSVDSPDADAAIASYLQAQAAERQAIATQAKAEEDLRRAIDLHERGAVATKDLLGAQNDVAQARGTVETARAQLASRDGDASSCSVSSLASSNSRSSFALPSA